MTVHPGTNGSRSDVAVVKPETRPAPPVAPPVAPAPSVRRSTDYRLRGLDLDAPLLVEAPQVPKRKRHPSVRRRRRRLLAQSLVVLVVVALAAVGMRAWVVKPYSVTTTSMVPNIEPGTNVLVLKPKALRGSLGAGDIIVFEQPENAGCATTGHDLISRVIGLPGQTIWSVGQNIYVDGELLDEPDWRNPPFGAVGTTRIERTTIPEGSYFVMGDNRTDPCDSRSFGPIPESLVVGEVVATIARNGHPYVHGV
jgi:signal peptidase I